MDGHWSREVFFLEKAHSTPEVEETFEREALLQHRQNALLAARFPPAGRGLQPCGLPPAGAGGGLCRLHPGQPREDLPLHQVSERPREAAREGCSPAAAALPGTAPPLGADCPVRDGGAPRGRPGHPGVLPPGGLCHPLPQQGGPQQPAPPALPVLPGLRRLLQPRLPAGGSAPSHLQPPPGRGPGRPPDPLRLAPGPPRLHDVRAALPGTLLRGVPLPPHHVARDPPAAPQRPRGGLCGGRLGGRGADQPGLPLYLRGGPFLDAANYLLHASGHLHAGGAAPEPHRADGLPDGLRQDGRPPDPADDRGPMDGHREHPHLAGRGDLVPHLDGKHAGGVQAAGPFREPRVLCAYISSAPQSAAGASLEIPGGGGSSSSTRGHILREEPQGSRWRGQGPWARAGHGPTVLAGSGPSGLWSCCGKTFPADVVLPKGVRAPSWPRQRLPPAATPPL